jgi:hypothetical protein
LSLDFKERIINDNQMPFEIFIVSENLLGKDYGKYIDAL